MGYVLTGIGVVLKAILSVVLSLTGETETSGVVSAVIDVIALGCAGGGIAMSCSKLKGKEVIKPLIFHGLLIFVGFFAAKVLVWIIIIAGFVLFIAIGSKFEPKEYNHTITYNGQQIRVRKIDDQTYQDPEGNTYTVQ